MACNDCSEVTRSDDSESVPGFLERDPDKRQRIYKGPLPWSSLQPDSREKGKGGVLP